MIHMIIIYIYINYINILILDYIYYTILYDQLSQDVSLYILYINIIYYILYIKTVRYYKHVNVPGILY